MHNQKGFTLVELLIVISLIAILSVGVLATINPIEQRNKATDANTSNDAGEVLNAYERYYTNNSSYPWGVIDPSILTDDAFGAISNTIGFGLCGMGEGSTGADVTTQCSSYDQMGALVSSDELKNSFLQKGYGKVVGGGAGQVSFDKLLYMYKADAQLGHNSIYVCFVPKAKSNRTRANNLKQITFTGCTGASIDPNLCIPSAVLDAGSTMFDTTGNAVVAFTNPTTSLFKCVP
ncbi:MAG: type II secretion system protein [Candidatus Shapirobacteria bacterium]|jgi:prepilin-type N-terminal cleavage/methylation domain-containing protein